MRSTILWICIVAALAAASSVRAQHDHDTSNQAKADKDLGSINFPTSGPAEAQKHFIRGVLLLHSFEYARAIAAFDEAIKIAPDFAMAYWGKAMAYDHRIWGEQDQTAALKALSQLGATPAERRSKAPTERERMYLDAVEALYRDGTEREVALAYSNAVQRITQKFPDDIEARAFYALSLLGLTGTTRNTENYMRAAAVAEEIFQKEPNHPGALHYLIHAYDDPVHAPLGLRAARLYGTVAKGASHAQHMPSHIFFALGMWDEAIAANIDSMKTARDAGGGGYHPLHWLEYAYLQMGKFDEAAKLAAIVASDVKQNSSRVARSHLAMARATFLVEAGDRADASMFERVDTTGFNSPLEFAGHDLAIGLEFARRNDLPAANAALERLRKNIAAAKASLAGNRVADRYDGGSTTEIDIAAVAEAMLAAAIDSAAGRTDEGIRKAMAAADADDKLVFQYGPPVTVKPAWELAGELLLKAGRKTEAADAFKRALKNYPNRRLSKEGLEKASRS